MVHRFLTASCFFAMAPALTTTKRKFHKILDSISNASSPSLVSRDELKSNASTITLPSNLEPPAKRLRPTSAFEPKKPGNHSTWLLSSLRDPPRPSTSSSMEREHKAPNFTPWDRAQFLERLKTFRFVDKWMGKPEPINEVQWAKRGWSCVGKERVGCAGGCGKEVVITLEDDSGEGDGGGEDGSADGETDWRKNAQEQLVAKYAEMITTAHEGSCLWRRRGCDGMNNSYGITKTKFDRVFDADTIHRLALAHQATSLGNLRLRYESLAAMSSEIPSTLSTPSVFDLSQTSNQLVIISKPPSTPLDIAPTTPTTPAADPPICPSAFVLALFGWQAEASPITGLVSCAACFRRLGLWLFKAPNQPSSTAASSPPTSPIMNRLDVIAEHRTYCPWINPTSQSGVSDPHNPAARFSTSGLAGWEILLRAIKSAPPPPSSAENPPHGRDPQLRIRLRQFDPR